MKSEYIKPQVLVIDMGSLPAAEQLKWCQR